MHTSTVAVVKVYEQGKDRYPFCFPKSWK